jgi:hypothetical protein
MKDACGPYIAACGTSAMTAASTVRAKLPVSSRAKKTNDQILSGLTADPDSGTRPDNGSLAVQWVSASHDLHDPVERTAAAQAVMTDTLQGRLTPRIVDRFRLQDAAKAHERLADRTVTGKLLLHP